ncbi:MAG: ATP-binding protein [Candidatus Bipolaricaulis sp.]|nr:ATP-binding protein [Candidatus Bipolaricaulis sp.]MDD5219103.1 ATP-binding protein [Candidatus Bipolaricaulis sp.]MDD5645860.1 ATP-binding protein [Candidatus Bipolaricaulis sp.]
MARRFPLAVKLGLAFFITIVLSVVLVYFLTAMSTTSRFDDYRQQKRAEFAELLSSQLAWYWERFGGWVGVDQILYHRVSVRIGEEVYEGLSLNYDVRFSLANEEGRVFLTTERDTMGKYLTTAEVNRGVSITVDGQRVGTLVPVRVAPELDPQEAAFLGSAKRSALIGGGIATVIAFVLAVFLISQILSPLRTLSAVTEQVARGDLPEKVRLRSRDEFAGLGESFDRMVDNLRRSERLRETMTADIAHELRTPVTIIQGTLEAVLDGIYEPTAQTIAPIYEETLHLGRLIDDLRDLALAEAGELRLARETIDVGQLVRQVVEAVVPSRDDAPRVDVVVGEGLLPIPVDPKRIRQVIANLLSNALRYTPTDGRIEISVEPAEGGVEVHVADTGPGISAEDLPHLFERFYRGDPARNRSGGSGLGLAIARQWVEAHGGRIWAENNRTGGARFTFRLPPA